MVLQLKVKRLGWWSFRFAGSVMRGWSVAQLDFRVKNMVRYLGCPVDLPATA